MKKFISLILVVAMLMTVSTSVFAATVDTASGSDSADVKAKYNSATLTDVYSVDITWGSMEFDYNEAGKNWNAADHKWVNDASDPAGWEVKNASNTIKVVNHSSKALKANFDFTANAEYTDLNGKFTYNNADLSGALDLELPKADTEAKEYVVYFAPTGDIPDTHNKTTYAKIGAITITLA